MKLCVCVCVCVCVRMLPQRAKTSRESIDMKQVCSTICVGSDTIYIGPRHSKVCHEY